MTTLDRLFVCEGCTALFLEARDKDECPACGHDETETVENLDGEFVERSNWFSERHLAGAL